VFEAQDNLLKAKVTQAAFANEHCGADLKLDIGDRVMLSTENRQREYAAKGDKRAAKFMPRFNGPYIVAEVNPKKLHCNPWHQTDSLLSTLQR
jgi:hypothetical protein